MPHRPLDAGRLDKRVTIQSRVESDDSGGGTTIVYTDLATVRAGIEPGTGREFVAAQQLTPELSHTVMMRYRRGITPNMRIAYTVEGAVRTFAIHAITDPMERHEQLVCYCSEVTQT